MSVAVDRNPAVARRRMPDFVPPQLCRPTERPPGGTGWVHEIKFDGYRVQARVEAGEARVSTRAGHDWTPRFPGLVGTLSGLPDALLDGEVVALDAGGMPDYPALQADIASGRTEGLTFFAFDLLFLDGQDLRKLPLLERKELLRLALRDVVGRVRYVDHVEGDGGAVFESAKAMGLEGIVSKRAKSVYLSGRMDSWAKAKHRPSQEVVLGGWTERDGKFRSLVGGVFVDGKLTYTGRIGTGFSEAKLALLLPALAANGRRTSPFPGGTNVPAGRKVHWLEPVLVAEVEHAGWSTAGSARQQAFKGLRHDRAAADVTSRS